jgi:hypothetical protein
MNLILQPDAGPIYPVSPTPFVKTMQVSSSEPAFWRRPAVATLDPHGAGLGRHVDRPRTVKRPPILTHRVLQARQTGFRLVADPAGWVALDDVFRGAASCETQMRKFSTQDNAFPDYALPSVTKHLIAGQQFCVVS